VAKVCEDTEQKNRQPWKDGVCPKEAKLSAREVDVVKEGKGDAHLQRSSLFTVCQRWRGFSEEGETIVRPIMMSDIGHRHIGGNLTHRR